ncbi:NAD-dependent epimerase/dehydratase family protein [bacterium]|nr:NAD-dependent epimerase/dehydratase family protein [bacterium]
MNKILITGGSGMVGNCLKKYFPNAYIPTSKELDLTNSEQVKNYFYNNKFDYVIHLAAHVGSLHDNIKNRTLYFDENILMNTLVTKYAYKSGVKNFLGVLSTCIYPNNINNYPIKETQLHNGPPHPDLLSYAYAKRSHAVQLLAYKETYNINYNYLIPCNLFGIVSEKHKNRSHFVNDLIFKIINSKNNNLDYITLFGDGTPLRQFMYAEDFAKIIYEYINKKLNISFNVAPDNNMSIEQLAKVAIKTCNQDMLIKYDNSKPNGQYRKDVDTSLFKKHIDFSFTPLSEGIKAVYNEYK